MRPAFALIHSPAVGPSTWRRVAASLEAAGWEVIVPSLLSVAEGGPPFWPQVVASVREALVGFGEARSAILVLHSGAGIFAPVLVAELGGRVPGLLFADAALPSRAAATPVLPPPLVDHLRRRATDGRLPKWTEWWDEAEAAALFPDAETRALFAAEVPRLPLAYLEASVPAPAGWDELPCGYLSFGGAYEEEIAMARGRGWLVEALPGQHLHLLLDPDGVAGRLLSMAGRLGLLR